jgi:hypothetical protein
MNKKIPKMNVFSSLHGKDIKKPVFNFIIEIKWLKNVILILSILA